MLKFNFKSAIKAPINFDELKFLDDQGEERWSARDLQDVLGYDSWRRFEGAIERAKVSIENMNMDVSSHVDGAVKLVERPQGGSVEKRDYHLSRFGAYILVMNGDPRKPEIAAAQGYFAVMTRIAEVYQLEAELKKVRKDRDDLEVWIGPNQMEVVREMQRQQRTSARLVDSLYDRAAGLAAQRDEALAEVERLKRQLSTVKDRVIASFGF